MTSTEDSGSSAGKAPPLAGRPPLPVLSFSKDWNEDETSNHHVLRELARTRKVVWLNSISMRAPRLGSRRDLHKIVAKVRAFARGPVEAEPNLWIYTPLVFPYHGTRLALALNRWLLRATLRAIRRRLGIGAYELWSFLPTAGDYLGQLGETLLVYYCTDEFSLFSGVDRERTLRAERRLLERADVVFATSQELVDAKRPQNPATVLASHGVDHPLFAHALSPETPIPEDLARLPRPVIGFYGTLQDWVDQPLLERLAERHPEWSIVLIGQAMVDVSRLRRHANVHCLGRRPHGELPAYCKGFAVAIIPYLLSDPRIRYVNPVKLREYLSAGLPVVSTALPELLRLDAQCAVARDTDGFEAAIVRALATDTPEARRQRSESMRDQTWDRRVAALREVIGRSGRGRSPRRGA